MSIIDDSEQFRAGWMDDARYVGNSLRSLLPGSGPVDTSKFAGTRGTGFASLEDELAANRFEANKFEAAPLVTPGQMNGAADFANTQAAAMPSSRYKTEVPQAAPTGWQAPTYYDARKPEPAPLPGPLTQRVDAVGQDEYAQNPAGFHAQMFPAQEPVRPAPQPLETTQHLNPTTPTALPRLMADHNRINTTRSPMVQRRQASGMLAGNGTSTIGTRG